MRPDLGNTSFASSLTRKWSIQQDIRLCQFFLLATYRCRFQVYRQECLYFLQTQFPIRYLAVYAASSAILRKCSFAAHRHALTWNLARAYSICEGAYTSIYAEINAIGKHTCWQAAQGNCRIPPCLRRLVRWISGEISYLIICQVQEVAL